MTLSSMTGFGRAKGARAPHAWTWEAKSVNGRNLEVRCRLPNGFDALEMRVREAAQAAFKRGSFNIALTLTRETPATAVRVNREALDAILREMKVLAKEVDAGRPSFDGLFGLKGVIETVETPESEAEHEALEAALLASLGTAFAELARVREQEGARLHKTLAGLADEIEKLTSAAALAAGAQPEAIRGRFETQLKALLEGKSVMPQERLMQEAALLASKADIREELDRLKAHIAQARQLLSAPDAQGRRLDFLTQELMREANTLCAKSGDAGLTRIGLDLKAAIDRFREQVQNVE